MKRLNLNAVRCAHYPNHPLWYELCSKLGLYVVGERAGRWRRCQPVRSGGRQEGGAAISRGRRPAAARGGNPPALLLHIPWPTVIPPRPAPPRLPRPACACCR